MFAPGANGWDRAAGESEGTQSAPGNRIHVWGGAPAYGLVQSVPCGIVSPAWQRMVDRRSPGTYPYFSYRRTPGSVAIQLETMRIRPVVASASLRAEKFAPPPIPRRACPGFRRRTPLIFGRVRLRGQARTRPARRAPVRLPNSVPAARPQPAARETNNPVHASSATKKIAPSRNEPRNRRRRLLECRFRSGACV